MESHRLGLSLKRIDTGGILLLASLLIVSPVRADVVISEIMAADGNPVLDADSDRSDWVELFNRGSESVSLAGWTLSDELDSASAWVFPEVLIAPQSFLVVFASGKDCRDPEGELHTDFRLRRSGEPLELRDSSGLLVSHFEPEFPKQYDSLSFGPAMNTVVVPVITEESNVRYHVPTPEDGANAWRLPGFDDSTWSIASGSLGYDAFNPPRLRSFIDSDFSESVLGEGASVYARYRVAVRSPDDVLRLRFRYDDGLVLYLNGRQIFRNNAPSRLDYRSRSSRVRDLDDVLQEETLVLEQADGLRVGENILACHMLNVRHTDRDFLLSIRSETLGLPDSDLGPLRYFGVPTPGLPNIGGTPSVLDAPVASAASGLYPERFDVTLVSPGSDLDVRYTLDGSLPSHSSAVYRAPISIDTSRVLRAQAYSSDGIGGVVGTWHYIVADDEVQSFHSNLPVVVVNMLDANLSATTANRALVQIFDRGESGRSTLAQEPTLSEEAGVKVRGSSTEGRPKKALNVEFRDAFGEDLDREVLGMPAESDWILYAPYNFDRALIRNAFMYELSNQIGMYAVRTRFCEVYVNSRRGRNLSQASYVGVYVLMEKIKRGSDRVPVEKLLSKHTRRPEVSGGYILKIDRLDPGDSGFSAGGQAMAHVYPKEENRTSAQLNFLRSHFDGFDRALRGRTPTDPIRGYPRYIDVDSFADFHMLNEFSKNPDGLRLSTYMHIPRNQKLTMGPIWDFDRTMGPDDDGRAASPNGRSSVYNYSWWGRLFQVPDFQQLYADRWQMWRDRVMTKENLMSIIDNMAEELTEAQERNFDRWNLVDRTAGWRREINHLKTWVRRRIDWFDSEFVARPVPNLLPGIVEAGRQVWFEESDAEVFVTTDGSDCRLPGGGVSESAVQVTADNPLTVQSNLVVTARTRVEGRRGPVWSAPFRGYYLLPKLPSLVISEVMYHPSEPEPGSRWSEADFEFIELRSVENEPVDLLGIQLRGGVQFEFPGGVLSPGEVVLVVANKKAFLERYPGVEDSVIGEFEGNLSNRGELIGVEDVHGRLISQLTYEDRGDWDPLADGEGYSLEFAGSEVGGDGASGWRASHRFGGTPGEAKTELLSLENLSVREGQIVMTLDGDYIGRVVVQRTSEIDALDWETIAEVVLAAGEEPVEISDSIIDGRRFYRVRVLE